MPRNKTGSRRRPLRRRRQRSAEPEAGGAAATDRPGPDTDEAGERTGAAVAEPEILLAGAEDDPVEVDPFVEDADAPTRAAKRALVPARPADAAAVDPLTRYIQEAHRFAELEREEEIDLARLYRETGDPEAAYRLVTANLQLVVKIALMFRRAIRNMLDLIQEGNVGLIEALRRFDPDQNVRFSTYAAWWIKAYILKFLLDNHRLVRVGTTNARRKLLYNLRSEQRALEEQGIRPTPRLLARQFGVSEQDVEDVQKALAGADLPIDAPVGDEGRETFADLMPARQDVEAEVVDQDMHGVLRERLSVFRNELGEREKAILDRRLLAEDPATLQDLGEEFGVTREAIRQSEARLMGRLKDYLSAELGEEAILHFTGGGRR